MSGGYLADHKESGMANQEIEIRWIVAVLRRWWWSILLISILATGIAYIVTSRMPPLYEASATLLISPAKNSTTSQYNDLMASERLALTYSEMLKERTVLAAVITELGLDLSPGDLAEKIEASPIRDTQLIKIIVSDSDPERAALIANTIMKVFQARVETLSTERYSATIANAEERVDDLQARVYELETQVETLRSQKVAKDIHQSNEQIALDSLWKDFQSVQSNQQQLEISISGATGNIYIFEVVQVNTANPGGLSVASAVVSVGKAQENIYTSSANVNIALTYGKLIIKTPFLQKIINDLGLTETPNQLASKITLEPVDSTQLMRVTVKDLDANKAELICKTLVDSFITQVKDLLAEPYNDRLVSIEAQLNDTGKAIAVAQAEIGQLTAEIAQLEVEIDRQETSLSEYRTDLRDAQKNLEETRITAAESKDTVIISDQARAPIKPSRNRVLYIGLAGLIGLAVGAGMAFLFTTVDDRIRTDQDIPKELDLPVLSTIGRFDRDVGELVMLSEPSSSAADDFRVLGMHIRRYYEKEGLHTLLVTSPTPREGKTIVTTNLALALAHSGLGVIAVDADMRLPRLHKIFGLDQGMGLAATLAYGYTDGRLQNTQSVGLKVMTSGTPPPNPAELLTTPNLELMIKELAGVANVVVIDCPPVLMVADALILAPMVDGVLLVLKAGQSESNSTKRAIEALRQVNARLVGVVLNAVSEHKERYYDYYRSTESGTLKKFIKQLWARRKGHVEGASK